MSRRVSRLSRPSLLAALLIGGAAAGSLLSIETPPFDGGPPPGPPVPAPRAAEPASGRLEVDAPAREEAGALRVVLRSSGGPAAPSVVPVRFRSAEGDASFWVDLPLGRPTP
ncbi:MAG: hypothetical protein ACF8XB_15975, partial [Planctomycetota bacterium JB042]